MKFLILIISFFITINIFSDIVKIDEIVSINFPKKVEKISEKSDGRPIDTFSLLIEKELFQVIRAEIFPDNFKIDRIPSNENTMNVFYTSFIDGISSEMESANCKLKESVKIKYKSLSGYKITYINKDTNNIVYEGKLFIVNNHIYSLSYFNQVNFNEENKEKFLNSLTIDESKQIKFNLPVTGKSRAYVLGQGIGRLLAIGLLVFVLIRILKRKKKDKINIDKQE